MGAYRVQIKDDEEKKIVEKGYRVEQFIADAIREKLNEVIVEVGKNGNEAKSNKPE